MMIKIAYWLVLCACFLCLGCSGGLSRSDAASLIQKSQVFSRVAEERFSLGSRMTTHPIDTALTKLGYAETVDNLIVLTEKGQRESANWKRADAFSREAYSIPVIRREIVEITDLSESKTAAGYTEATFTWRWKPVNDIGEALDIEQKQRTYVGAAIFQKSNDGWHVARITGDSF